ncbi:hypothetical protein HMI54_012577 [Coelomomyces lativittatus]|nr:hypothetical protein HMI54_012577 [Coelomomyces lativittatus]
MPKKKKKKERKQETNFLQCWSKINTIILQVLLTSNNPKKSTRIERKSNGKQSSLLKLKKGKTLLLVRNGKVLKSRRGNLTESDKVPSSSHFIKKNQLKSNERKGKDRTGTHLITLDWTKSKT